MTYQEKSREEIQTWWDSLDDCQPGSFNLICEEFGKWRLTTNIWTTVGYWGRSRIHETGVRNLKTGKFTLIQHNWADYKYAHEEIKKRLKWKKSLSSIENFMYSGGKDGKKRRQCLDKLVAESQKMGVYD